MSIFSRHQADLGAAPGLDLRQALAAIGELLLDGSWQAAIGCFLEAIGEAAFQVTPIDAPTAVARRVAISAARSRGDIDSGRVSWAVIFVLHSGGPDRQNDMATDFSALGVLE